MIPYSLLCRRPTYSASSQPLPVLQAWFLWLGLVIWIISRTSNTFHRQPWKFPHLYLTLRRTYCEVCWNCNYVVFNSDLMFRWVFRSVPKSITCSSLVLYF